MSEFQDSHFLCISAFDRVTSVYEGTDKLIWEEGQTSTLSSQCFFSYDRDVFSHPIMTKLPEKVTKTDSCHVVNAGGFIHTCSVLLCKSCSHLLCINSIEACRLVVMCSFLLHI